MMFSLLPVSAAAKWYGEHNVTVKYVFNDDSPNSKPDDVKKTIASTVGAITTFKVEKAGYNHSAKVTSGNAECSIDGLGFLHVRHVDADSVITVTYTPKGNVITIDQYYNNGTILAQWATNFKVNGLNIVENNKLEKGAIIDNTELTDATEKYRFLTVGGKTYDFSYARQIPSPGESSDTKLAKVWYERDTGEWYYAHLDNAKLPLGNKSGVNFCYNKEHTEGSEYHQFDQVVKTVLPTCTEQGYTVYQCAYCTETEKREYTGPLGHQWGDWVHVDGTEKENSKHQRVCQRPGCGAKDTPVMCNFEAVTTGTKTTYTCTACGHSYTDEITPTETFVYVYFQTVHPTDGGKQVNVGVKYNGDTGHWATLGKLKTTTVVTAGEKDHLGAKVKAKDGFAYHSDNDKFNLSLITSWDELKEEEHGARGYVEEAPLNKKVWHLNGTVNVYKLSYKANPPDGVAEKAVTGMPKSAYYLPNATATVSTDIPELQGYDFGGWYTNSKCEGEAIGTVTVTEDTVLYAKWTSRAQPTADLIDNNIIIKHSVNGDPEHGNDDDTTAHIVNKNAKISYQATLDMSKMMFSDTPEHKETVNGIKLAMVRENKSTIWDYMKDKDIGTFADSKVNLHVKFSDKLVNPTTLGNITLESGWFKLDPDPANKPTYDETTKYWTIPCVIKNAKDEPNTNDSIITLSGITLSLTDKAQGMLNSNTALDIISEGYIDGTIKIYDMYELSLIGRSQGDPAQNTAKLKTYTVTYDGNGADSGKTTDPTAYAAGEKAKVKDNGFTRSGYTFTGWNMQEDGKGKSYKIGDKIPMTGSVTLYAQWNENSSGGGGDDSKTYYYFAIQKVDAQDGHALNGAKFELYQLDKNGKVVNHSETKTRQHRSENGIALFSVDNKNSYKGIWYYAEVTAPEGYVLDSTEHKITKNDFSTSQNEAIRNAKRVRNYRGTTPDLLNGDDHFAYVVGYQDGCVHPDALITRAETATIFFRLLKDSVRDGNLLTSNTFADVPNAYWANTAISTMAGLGIVQGYNSTAFDPNASITRAEFAAICARFDTGKSSGTQTFTDIKGHWAEKYIERAAELGWIKGLEDGTFRPNDCITRAQAMTMINRVLNRIPEDASDLLSNMNVWPDCNPGDWFYLAVQEATNSHDFKHKAGNYETWTGMKQDPDWTRYEN